MRLVAIIPALLSAAALVLTFLCLFAGNKPGFMEDYAIITLNTSRFGENAVNLTASDPNSGNDNIFQSLVNDITNAISDGLNDGINYLARDLGLKDFYSLHILDWCEGYYEPTPIPNATVSNGQIWQNITKCSNRTALFEWNPRQQLQDDLDDRGFGWLNVTALKWPSGIDDNIDSLRGSFKASFVLYCISIALMVIAFALAVAGIFLVGRVFATINIVVDSLAFLAVMIASALVTTVMQQGAKQINSYGNDVGVTAYGSSKLLVITWVATALMLIASIIWCFACFTGRREKGTTTRRRWRRRGPEMADAKGRY